MRGVPAVRDRHGEVGDRPRRLRHSVGARFQRRLVGRDRRGRGLTRRGGLSRGIGRCRRRLTECGRRRDAGSGSSACRGPDEDGERGQDGGAACRDAARGHVSPSGQQTGSRLVSASGPRMLPAGRAFARTSNSLTLPCPAVVTAGRRVRSSRRPTMTTYPLVPKTSAHLRPGQFWSIPMADGRFGCGRVLRVDHDRPTGGRTRFIAAILDWVGDSPPSSESIAGSPVLGVGNAHVRIIAFGGGAILGERPLAADGIEPPATVDSYWGDGFGVMRVERRFIAGDPQPTSDFREVSSPLTAEMLRPAPTGRGVVQFRSRLTDDDLRQPRRVVPRVPGDDAPGLRLLRPLDHRHRVPAVLPDVAAVRRGRAVGLADISRRPAPSAPGARRAGDRGHEGAARPCRAVAVPGAAVALPRGSDEAPGGDLGSYAGCTTSRCARSRCPTCRCCCR